jgi:phospholipid/cholesterol/gamma-HCH transport system permease protein
MGFLINTGSHTREIVQATGYTLGLGMRTFASVAYLPRRLRFTLDHAFAAGVRALPVTAVVALFAGMILALQTGIELRKFGQSGMIGSVTAISMCREMGPFITAIILAAMVGSSMAAEVGTMTVSEEVTALDVMSIDSTNYLALPRVVALTLMCPILTVFSNLIGIAGGSLAGVAQLDVSPMFYWLSVRDALFSADTLFPKDIYVGLFKAIVFGCTIATVSCSAGLRADGGALGVGRAVQHAVMTSIVLIIIFGYLITWFFYFLVGS